MWSMLGWAPLAITLKLHAMIFWILPRVHMFLQPHLQQSDLRTVQIKCLLQVSMLSQ